MAFIYSVSYEYLYISPWKRLLCLILSSVPDHAGRNITVFCSKTQSTLNSKTHVTPGVSGTVE